MRTRTTHRRPRWRAFAGAFVVLAAPGLYLGTARTAAPAKTAAAHSAIAPVGELDCNGDSPVQKSMRLMLCTDIRGIPGNPNVWDHRFYDNGVYIGHDEPDLTFLSRKAGSGNNVTWTETLGADPKGPYGTSNPGKDKSAWFELTPAP